FIFTKHALERSKIRSVSLDAVVSVLQKPDTTKPTEKENTSKFIRLLNDRLIHVVATYLPEQQKWLVVSVWVRGEEDKPSLSWQLISFPFKALWWLLKKLLTVVTHC